VGASRGMHAHARCCDAAVHSAWLEATHTVLVRGAGTDLVSIDAAVDIGEFLLHILHLLHLLGHALFLLHVLGLGGQVTHEDEGTRGCSANPELERTVDLDRLWWGRGNRLARSERRRGAHHHASHADRQCRAHSVQVASQNAPLRLRWRHWPRVLISAHDECWAAHRDSCMGAQRCEWLEQRERARRHQE